MILTEGVATQCFSTVQTYFIPQNQFMDVISQMRKLE